jgi:two-component system chemotaxis response regulator CheY
VTEPKTIYVIDDDTALRSAYSAALSRLGYRTQTAADGVKGQALLKTGRPDLILLDMLMPNLDGVGFLKGLRADPETAAIKVVVVSNFESAPEAAGLGVSKYLSKMESAPEDVAAAVDKILQAP